MKNLFGHKLAQYPFISFRLLRWNRDALACTLDGSWAYLGLKRLMGDLMGTVKINARSIERSTLSFDSRISRL